MQPRDATTDPPQAAAGMDPHLRELLRWLDQLLAWQVVVSQQQFGAIADDVHRGLYISDDEALLLSSGPYDVPPALVEARAALAAERERIDAGAVGPSPLRRLADLFGLSPLECDVILLTLVPEIALHYERLYGYIQDDVTRKRPTVQLALRLLCLGEDEALAARAVFAPQAPLLHQRIIHLYEDGQRHAPLLAHFIKLDPRIVDELLGSSALDPVIAPYVSLIWPRRGLDQLVLPAEFVERLRATLAGRAGGLVLALHGGYGSGRQAIAEGLCGELGCPLLLVNSDQLLESDLAPEERVQHLVREATLQGAALLWQHGDVLFDDDERARHWRPALLAALDEHAGLSFFALERAWEARGALRRTRFLCVEIPPLAFSGRERIWRERLEPGQLDDAALQVLASTFRLSPGQIRDAISMARSLHRWRAGGPAERRADLHDMFAACRAQSGGRLAGVARRVRPAYSWDNLVLPPEPIAKLREICMQVRHRRTVLERWGFDRHLAMGKGVNVLFAGPSGTGKTMASEILAADLGLELYKIDLSALVSKYIGETEKNLDRIFQAAGEANAILFFDEADAIFGKRSEVKDAHDRYANIEVGYLLQRIEEYDGVVILATNLRKNMDDAFVRRLHVAIDFPFPDEAERCRIWQQVFPAATPLAEDVDPPFLARQFKLAGGNIRNIALLAAFLAAEEGDMVSMRHVIRALKREYQKLGKLVTEAEFGTYIGLLRP